MCEKQSEKFSTEKSSTSSSQKTNAVQSFSIHKEKGDGLFLQLVRLGSSCFSREELEEEISNVLFRIPISSFWVWLGVGMVLYFWDTNGNGMGKGRLFWRIWSEQDEGNEYNFISQEQAWSFFNRDDDGFVLSFLHAVMGIVGFYPGDSEFVYRHGERLEPRKGLQIVIMEAQREEREDLGRCLEEQGHYVVAFPDENSALFYLEKHRVDVIVWGWDYNKKEDVSNEECSFESNAYIKRLRQSIQKKPCVWIVLAAEPQLGWARENLSYWFDECFSKNMSAQELSYWIKRFSLNSSVFKVGPFIIDYESEEISCHGEKLFLSIPEFEFLRLLLESEGKNVSFEVLASALFVDENAYKNIGIKENLRQRAYLIRNKLEESGGNRTWIKNSRSRGYRIEIN